MIDLESTFEKFDEEYIKFGHVENPPSSRPDLCAFITLDRLLPGPSGRDLVSAAEHDEIWLDVDTTQLAEVATEDDILLLVRCGVRLDTDIDSLALYV